MSNRSDKTSQSHPEAQPLSTASADDLQNTQIAISQEVHQGPLPHPHTLAMYDQVVPGSADRIIAMAEKQQAHRLEMESRALASNNRDSLLGIISGAMICLSAIGGGVLVAIYGHAAEGTWMSSIGLASLVGVFVYGTRSRRHEREAKFRMAQQK